MATCSVIGCPNSGERNPNVFYVTLSSSNRSHVAWLQQNINQQIIALDDTITVCQLHFDFGSSFVSQPVQPPQPPAPAPAPPLPEQIRPTETKSVQVDLDCTLTKTVDKVLEPPSSGTKNAKLDYLLSEPSTSKATHEGGDAQIVSDLEQYYKNNIERQVIDIKASQLIHFSTSVSPYVVKTLETQPKVAQEKHKADQETCTITQKRRKIAQEPNKVDHKTHKISQEVQIISDDDDVVEIKTECSDTQVTESFPVTMEKVDDEQTRSGDDNIINTIADNEIILRDGNSIIRRTISIDPVKEEPEEDNNESEEELILLDVDKPTLTDPLKLEPENEIRDLEYEEAQFEDELAELENIKEESPTNSIDIGETEIQAISTSITTLDGIFATLDNESLTVADKKHLSTIIFDQDCILNKKYIYNDHMEVFAKELYFCSEKAYNFMATYIPCLPPVEHIKKKFITSNGEPGFSKEALDCLKTKARFYKDSYILFCTLAINDVELKVPEGQRYRVAFIITAVGLHASWKLPICYFITSDLINSRKRVQLIQLAITLVENSGVAPRAVCYLPIFQNIEMAESLSKNYKNKKMFCAVSCREMYLIPDPVYIVDKFRISGCEDQDRMLISVRHIELLVKYLGRIRPGKMTNRLLGKSLTHSLEVCTADFISSGMANVRGTVVYLTMINKFLDIITSHPGGTSWKESVKLKNMKKVTSFLQSFQKYLSNISPKYKSNPFWINNTARGQLKFDIRCLIDVLSMAVFGVQSLVQKLTGAFDLNMKKLTMNSTAFLANFYHVVNDGEMREMMVEEFIARYKQNLQYMKPHLDKSENNPPIAHISVLDVTSPVQRINVTTYLLNSNKIIRDKQFEINIRDDLYKILKFDARDEYSNLSTIYVAGYVVYNLVRRLRCDTCISVLLQSNKRQDDDPYNTEIVIQKPERDSSSKLCVKLMDPSVDVVRICKATDAVLKRAIAQSDAEKQDILQRYSIPLLTLKIKKDMIGKDYFKSLDFHRHDTNTLENHVVELAKAVAEVYLQIRLKYRTRHF